MVVNLILAAVILGFYISAGRNLMTGTDAGFEAFICRIVIAMILSVLTAMKAGYEALCLQLTMIELGSAAFALLAAIVVLYTALFRIRE